LKYPHIKNHPLYPEYAKIRIRERKLLRDKEELRKEGIHNADFLKACRLLALGKKKLDELEKVLSKNTV